MTVTGTQADTRKLHIWGWGLGSIGLATIHNTLNVLLVAYLVLVVGIAPDTAGFIVLLTKIFDVITDIPMGRISDNTRSPMGRRRPYLLAGAFVAPVAMYILFTAGNHGSTQAIVGLLLYATGYTLFNVPYLAMPAEMSNSPDVRTNMLGVRSFAIAAGTCFGVAVAPYLIGALGGGSPAYETLALVMALIVFWAFWGCFMALKNAPDLGEGLASMPLAGQLADVFSGRSFRMLMAIKVLHLLGLAIGAGSLLFFFRFALGYDAQTLGLYGAATTATWALSMPFWTRFAHRKGKRLGYMMATGAYTVLTLTWLLASNQEPMPLVLLRAAAFGFLSGGMLLMGNGMLQDIIQEDQSSSGELRAGLFAASYSLTEKITAGVGAQILGLILSFSGFDRALNVQSDEAISGIFFTIGFVPAVCMGLSMLAIQRYNLSEDSLRTQA